MRQRLPGIDDILGHQHVTPGDIAAQILENTHLAARFQRVAAGGCLDEIHLHRQIRFAHRIGDEHERAAQQPRRHALFGAREFGLGLVRQRLDARGDALGRNELVDHIAALRHVFPLQIRPQSRKNRATVT
jgi:hypothetical protein